MLKNKFNKELNKKIFLNILTFIKKNDKIYFEQEKSL